MLWLSTTTGGGVFNVEKEEGREEEEEKERECLFRRRLDESVLGAVLFNERSYLR
jgi:hypothetical protein